MRESDGPFSPSRRYKPKKQNAFGMAVVVGMVLLLVTGTGAALYFGGAFKEKDRAEATPTPPAGKKESKAEKLQREPKNNAPTATENSAVEKMIAGAAPFQAPPFDKDQPVVVNDFTRHVRKLATDSTLFTEFRTKVFRATFEQAGAIKHPLIRTTLHRNALVEPIRFVPSTKKATASFYLWQYHNDAYQGVDGRVAENTDACCLLGSFETDQTTAAMWRDKYEKGNLRLTVWFQFEAVQRESWKPHPQFPAGDDLTHDIVFEVKVLRVSESGDAIKYEPIIRETKSIRQQRLETCDAQGRAELAKVGELIKKHDEKLRTLERDRAKFEAERPFLDATNPAVFARMNGLAQRQEQLRQELGRIEQQTEESKRKWEQEKRKIFHDHPQAGDPKYTEHRGYYWTAEELAERKRYEEEHETVEKAAKAYMERVKKNPTSPNFRVVGITLLKQIPQKDRNRVIVQFRMSSVSEGKRFEQLMQVLFTKDPDGFWNGSDVQLVTP